MVVTIVILAVTSFSGVKSSSCNSFDRSHNFVCSSGYSIYHVWGYHRDNNEDRIYCYNCRYNGRAAAHCYTTGYVNSFNHPVVTLCNPNYYIAGVRSYHDNFHEDRRFNFRCCRNTGQCTRNCAINGPVNNFDGHMNHHLRANQVFVGAFSWHSNTQEYVINYISYIAS